MVGMLGGFFLQLCWLDGWYQHHTPHCAYMRRNLQNIMSYTTVQTSVCCGQPNRAEVCWRASLVSNTKQKHFFYTHLHAIITLRSLILLSCQIWFIILQLRSGFVCRYSGIRSDIVTPSVSSNNLALLLCFNTFIILISTLKPASLPCQCATISLNQKAGKIQKTCTWCINPDKYRDRIAKSQYSSIIRKQRDSQRT